MKDIDSRHWFYVYGKGTYDQIYAKQCLENTKFDIERQPEDFKFAGGYANDMGHWLTDQIYNKQNLAPKFSIGKKLEDFKFERGYAKNIDHWLKERLVRLRKKYGYIRLFFSGGKDSVIILQQAIKHDIFIDEIVYVVEDANFNLPLFPQYNGNIETLAQAEEYLKQVQGLIPKTKITKLVYLEEHYCAKFKNPNWIRKNVLFPYLVNKPDLSFWQDVNSEFKLLADIEDRCDLTGGAIPHYWYNSEIEKWQFCYSSPQMLNSMHDASEDFLVSDDCPELLNAFVEEITINLSKQNLYPTKFHPGDARQRRSYSSIFNFDIMNSDKDIPKADPNKLLKATDHPAWQFQDFKGFFLLINRMSQPRKNPSVDFYLNNTDWNLVLESHKLPAPTTKMFTIE